MRHSLVRDVDHERGDVYLTGNELNDSEAVVMGGSAGCNTGRRVDDRPRERGFHSAQITAADCRPDLHCYQWYATCLDAMGDSRNEWPHGPNQPFSTPAHATNPHPVIT